MESSRVTERGQITIDKAVRKQLGVKPGMLAYQRVNAGRLEILFLPAPHRDSMFGILHQEALPPGPMTGEEFEQAVMEGLAEEQRHRAKEENA